MAGEVSRAVEEGSAASVVGVNLLIVGEAASAVALVAAGRSTGLGTSSKLLVSSDEDAGSWSGESLSANLDAMALMEEVLSLSDGGGPRLLIAVGAGCVCSGSRAVDADDAGGAGSATWDLIGSVGL